MEIREEVSVPSREPDIDRSDAICPITFLNDRIVDDQHLNQIFTLPLNNKLDSDFGRSMFITDLNNRNAEEFICSIQTMHTMDIATTVTSLKSYFIMNCSDIIMSLIIDYSTKIFDATNNTLSNIYLPQYNEIKDLVDGTFNDANYDILVGAIIRNLNVSSADDKFKITFPAIDLICDAIFANVTNLFDTVIVRNITNAFGNSIEIYKSLYKDCYGSDPTNIPAPNMIYSFTAGILREIATKYLFKFRDGLMAIAFSAAHFVATLDSNMFYNYPIVTNNPTQRLKNNPYYSNKLKNVIGMIPNISDEDEDCYE